MTPPAATPAPRRIAAVATVILMMTTLMLAPSGLDRAAAAPSGEYATRLAVTLTGTTPLVFTADGPDTLTITGTITNTGPDTIDELSYRFQRGDRLDDVAALDSELDDASQPTAVMTHPFQPLPGALDAGGTRSFTVSVPALASAHRADDRDAEPTTSGLEISRPGVYPLMVNINGTIHHDGTRFRARVGELHLVVTVTSVPESPGGYDDVPEASTIGMVWPLTSTPHLGLNGVFRNDSLADAIAPGGRLARIVSLAAREAGEPGLVTVAIDPMLLDELDRMADGYRVLADPNRPQPRLRPTGTQPPGTVAGTGQQDAARILEALRTLAADQPVMILPYADPDIVALTRAGMDDAVIHAIELGRTTARRVLTDPTGENRSPQLVTTIALPPGGMLTDAAWQLLQAHGFTAAILNPDTTAPADADSAPTPGTTVVVTSGGATTPAVLTGGADAAEWSTLLHDGGTTESARQSNTLIARRLLGPATSTVMVTGRDFSPHRDGVTAVQDHLDALVDAGLARPMSIPAMAQGQSGGSPSAQSGQAAQHGTGSDSGRTGAVRVTLHYPQRAAKRELTASYLGQLTAVRDRITVLRRALSAAPDGPDPRQLLDTLADALVPSVSASLRGVDDPRHLTLTTIDDTLTWLYDGVSLQPTGGSYTLASATAPLLLTVHNVLPYEVSVGLRILGGRRAGLTTVDPGIIHVDPGPHSTPVTIESQVSRSGTFSVYVELTGPERQQWNDPVRLTIHSRAYGALTVILMIVAGGVLLLMVAWQLVRRWRGRGQQPDPDDDGPDDDDPENISDADADDSDPDSLDSDGLDPNDAAPDALTGQAP